MPSGSIPRVRSGSIQRLRLLERLRSTVEERVIAVTAPAGFGKTTLLTQWAAAESRPVVWLHVERPDNDPVELLRHLASMVEGASPRAPEPDDGGLGPVDRRLAMRVLRMLGQRGDGFLLVIDDAHRLTDPGARDVVDWIVRGLPARSQMALGSRVAPGLPLERWRAAGLLLELGPDDLALDRSECADLLEAVGVRGSDAEVESIQARTAGWAAGVYLIGRTVAGASAPDRARLIAGPRLEVDDHLQREVLEGLSPADRHLLVSTAILDRLSGPLCDAVAGVSGSAARLDALARTLWFVQPTGPDRDWFQCHSLLRRVLSEELRLTREADIPDLHRRAAAWYRDNGEVIRAVDHAFEAGDRVEAARLIVMNTQPLHAKGAMATLRGWYGRIGREDVDASPSVAAMAAWQAALDGKGADFERWLTAFEAADLSGAPVDGSASFVSTHALLRALDCRDGPMQMVRDATMAVDEEPLWSPWRSTALVVQGCGLHMAGDPDAAARSFREVVKATTGGAAAWCVATAECALGAIAARDWRDAEERIGQFRRVVTQTGMEDYVTSFLGMVVDARIRIHRGDLPRARSILVEAQMLRRLVSWVAPWMGVRALAEFARAQLLVGDVAGARACVAQLDDILDRRPNLGVLVDIAADIREQSRARTRLAGATSLTPAELRLLPLLQTYLTFREIGDHLGVSHNTIKTQALSVYSKFGVTSRSEAVDFAGDTGLLVPLFDLDRTPAGAGAPG